MKQTCESFEDSWWAYVMYSLVRAKSILEKIDNVWNINLSDISINKLDDIENDNKRNK